MDLYLLINFFKGQGTFAVIKADIQKEVEEFIHTSRHKDSSRLYVTNETEHNLSDADLIMLLNSYRDDQLTETELEYILSVLDLLERWDYSEKAREVIFDFCDPAIGYDITKSNITEGIRFLKGEVSTLDNCKTERHRE